MKKELKERLMQMVAEEQKNPVDTVLLQQLEACLQGESLDLVAKLSPQQRNALNAFLREIRDFMLQELMRGEYGASIVADSAIVMAFESGYKAGWNLLLGARKAAEERVL